MTQAEFALKLLRDSGPSGSFVILSPFSISVALAMVYAGADGKTKIEIGDALAKGTFLIVYIRRWIISIRIRCFSPLPSTLNFTSLEFLYLHRQKFHLFSRFLLFGKTLFTRKF